MKAHVDYTDIANIYDRYRTLPEDMIQFVISNIFGETEPGIGLKVLDVGCGTGRYTIPLAQTRPEIDVYGVDRSTAMLIQAKNKCYDRVLWVCGDAVRLPFKSGQFKYVLMMLVIHHIQDERSAVEEAYRVLSHGGKLIIQTFSHSQLRTRHKSNFLYVFPSLLKIDLSRFPTVPTLKRYLKNTGFNEVRSRVLTVTSIMDKSMFIDKIRHKSISTLTLISETEFENGLISLEKLLRPVEKIESTFTFTILTGEK